MPLEPKEIIYGQKNNLPKVDPYDITMSNQGNVDALSRDSVLDHGTQEIAKRYSN